MERYGWSYSTYLEEVGLHPEAIAMLTIIGEVRSEEMMKQSGKAKMGKELKGDQRDIDMWSRARSIQNKHAVAQGHAALMKKYPGLMR